MVNFAHWLTWQWQIRSFWQLLMRPLSWLYGAIVGLRRLAYQTGLLHTEALPVPVIVIGNLTAGGAGKTPLVIWLAQQLHAAGWQPGIISRGYGGSARTPLAVSKHSRAEDSGDEALLIAQRTGLPVWVGRNRPAVARALLAAQANTDILISDDGLQHTALARDIEIVVIDAARGFGNGQLLPAGPLREPLSRLGSVDALVVNQTGHTHASLAALPAHYRMQLVPAPIYTLNHPERTGDVRQLLGSTLHAIAGIAHPQRFFDQLQAAGLQFTAHAFADHHVFHAAELNFPGNLIMTEKDAVKCRDFAHDRMWVWPVVAQTDAALLTHILAQLEALPNGSKTA